MAVFRKWVVRRFEFVGRVCLKSRMSICLGGTVSVQCRKMIIEGLLRHCPTMRGVMELKIRVKHVTNIENHKSGVSGIL